MTFIQRIDSLSSRFLTERSYELIVGPAIADLQHDVNAASAHSVRGQLSVLVAFAGALYDEIVKALNREFSQFEQIKKFHVLPREFTIASGELTPTMKVKRKVVEQQWAAAIDQMYDDR